MNNLVSYIKNNKGFSILLILLIGLNIIFRCVYTPVEIDGKSMEPTYLDGQHGFSLKIWSEVERFDVVIIQNENTDSNYWIKRVIGLPGETISCKDNVLMINGKALTEEYLDESTITEDFGPITLGEDEYFVMGDNRSISKDSRWIGPINKNDIIAKGVWAF